MNFIGTGKRLEQGDIGQVAQTIGIPTAALLSILEVEAGGRGFDTKNRLVVLPEPHRFYAELGDTPQRLQALREGLAYPHWGERGYPKTQDARYVIIDKMIEIDEPDALKACSWGLPQILGSNYSAAGYTGPKTMVTDFMQGERNQIEGMARLLDDWGIARPLTHKDLSKAESWQGFARSYNGPGFLKNHYDTKLATAYLKHSAGQPMEAIVTIDPHSVIRVGQRGELVRNMQADLDALGYNVGLIDGRFGPTTEKAVKAFQKNFHLDVDGIVGDASWRAMETAIKDLGDKLKDNAEQTWDR